MMILRISNPVDLRILTAELVKLSAVFLPDTEAHLARAWAYEILKRPVKTSGPLVWPQVGCAVCGGPRLDSSLSRCQDCIDRSPWSN